MRRPSEPHDSQSDQREHEERSKVMLLQPYIPTNSSFISGIRSVNGTSPQASDIIFDAAVHDRRDTIALNSSSNSSGGTGTTSDYELEFYKSYDPSIGLHTAAVLGGILVWLVIYVIYRTKVRKCVIRLVRKKCIGEVEEGEEDGGEADSKKISYSEEKDSMSVVSPNMVRPFINPSIVIDSTPPESSPQSPATYDQYMKSGNRESNSPYPLQGNNHDGFIFQFPYSGHHHHHGHNQYQLYHQQFCQEAADLQHQQMCLERLPQSEIDIPTATAQWVQNMPLAARSHQDFAGLLLAMQSRGLLAMNKPCSCPLVCPRSPQPLPLLDFPSTWNKSLPALSSSISSQLLSAYETATSNHNGLKDIKEIINARRKHLNKRRNKVGSSSYRDHIEYTKLEQQSHLSECVDSNLKLSLRREYPPQQAGVKKKPSKSPPNLTIMIPDAKESAGLISHIALNRSPVPIPVTPTVMIQNSQSGCRRHAACDSNSSVTSSSSTDFLSSAPRHRSIQGNIPSPHLLSPQCENRLRRPNNANHFSWSKEDVQRLSSKSDLRRSGSVSPHPYHWHRCSFSKNGGCRHKGTDNGRGLKQRHGSWSDCDVISVVSAKTLPIGPNESGMAARSGHRRTLSDYNKYYADLMGPDRSSPMAHPHQHRRSLSADITYAMSQQRELASPTYSNGSNKNSLGTSSYSHSPSPHLLQVPDPNNLRPFTPDPNLSNQCQGQTPSGESQGAPRHYVYSDNNIAYYSGCSCQPGEGNNPIARRHSTHAPPITGETSLSHCADNSVRATSSFGSASSQGSANHPQHQFKAPHKHHCQHQYHRYSQHSHPVHHHSSHLRHNSTDMLASECTLPRANMYSQLCAPGAQGSMNRSYSAVIMETKL
ncbi:hypothetical protein Btru_024416 [Bulinus truncatus]|nr:hypothetical protein Btru_024416 [Bulinus truncatus]